MTGVMLLREVEGAGSTSSTSPTNTWTNIYGVGYAQTNVVIMAGLTGGHVAIDMSWTGSGVFYFVKNGALYLYLEFGPFTVANGDTLGFGVQNPSVGADYSGTITITDATHSQVLQTLSYLVKHP